MHRGGLLLRQERLAAQFLLPQDRLRSANADSDRLFAAFRSLPESWPAQRPISGFSPFPPPPPGEITC